MLRTASVRLATILSAAVLTLIPSLLHAQKALVYCPVGIDAAGCNAIVATLAADGARFPDGADPGYDGTQGTVDLAGGDLGGYAVFVVPSLADGPDAQPYALLRNGTIAGRLQAAFMGRVAVWSGTPDVGSTNRATKDELIRNLAAWARADAAGSHGPGVVALQDNSDDEAARYGWLGGISVLSASADPNLEVYSNVQVLTSTGTAILTNGSGLQIGYTNMASFGVVGGGANARNDATGGRSSRVVLLTAAGEPSDPTAATVSTDKEDYPPGETVIVTGTGWEPGETVTMVIHEDPLVHGDRSLIAVADENGGIYNADFHTEETDLGVRFTLVATGQTSGRTAQVTFTDDRVITAAKVNGAATTTVPAGGTVTAAVTVTASTSGAGGENWFSTAWRYATTPPGTTTCEDGTPDFTAVGSETATFSTTAPTTPGTYNAYFIAYRTANCGNNASNTFVLTNALVVTAAPDLTVSKSHIGNFTVGVPATYTITVTNSGSAATAGTVTVTDVQPSGLSFTGATGTGWTCSGTSTISCTRSSALAAGSSYPDITVNVNPTSAGTVTNVATVSGGGQVNTTNDSDSDPTTVVSGADLTVSKTHSGSFSVGVNGVYTLAVSNGGGSATTGTVVLTDVLPSGLGFVSAAGTAWTCGFATGTVTCTRTTAIAAGGTAPDITLTVSVAAAASPSVTNIASVSGGGEPAANNGNNSDSDLTTVAAGVDLTIDKSHTGNFTETVNGVYTLAVSNAGGTATSANVTVTDVLPAGLGFVSGTGTGWNNCTAAAGTVTCVRPAANTIPGGATAPSITLTVSVGAVAVPSVTNTASVDGGGEPAANNGNNSDSDPTTVIAANGPPVVEAGGPFSGAEGSAIALAGASATDPDAGDTPTYKWTYVVNGAVDAGTTCSFSNDAIIQPSFTCNDDGAFTLTLTVNDGHGHVVADNAAATVTNAKPTATAGGPYPGGEGSGIQLAGAGDDPAANDDDPKLTYKWTVTTTGIDAGGACSFDDDTKKNAKITCTDDGAFSISLVATDDDGAASDASVADLTVGNVIPVASAGGPYTGDEGAAIVLGGSATDVGANDTRTYKWTADVTGIDAGGACSFDDDTKTDAKVTCTDDGAFKVKLVATDDDGGASTAAEAMLTVANADPVADAGGPYDGNEGAAIQLNGSVTDAGSNDSHTWSWEYVSGPGLDAGATCSFTSATAEDPKITCTDDGEVKLTLTATDDNGGTGVDEATLTLANVPPVAHAGGPYTGDEGSAVLLAGSATDVAANDVISYQWTANTSGLDAGATCTFDDATKADARVTCTDDGTVQLTLKATDDDGGMDTDQATLTVTNAPPVANAGGPYTGNEGAAVQLNGSVSDVGANDSHQWSWQYIAGAGVDAGATCSFTDATAEDPKVTCTDDGEVKLTLKVKDDDGGEGTAEAVLTLANVKPTALAGGPYTGTEGGAVTLNGSQTDPGSNDTFSYQWTANASGIDAGGVCSFDDDTKRDAKVTCTDDGAFTLTLAVTDDDGETGTQQTAFTVQNANPVAVSGGPYTGGEGAYIPLAGSASDAGSNDTRTYLWTVNAGAIDASGACTFDDATKLNAKVKCTDDSNGGSFTLTLAATDDDAGVGTSSTTLVVTNIKPTIATLTQPDGTALPATLAVAGTLNIKVPFTEPASNDSHKAEIDCGTGYVNVNGGANVTSGFLTSCTFATVGTKVISVRVTDDDNLADVATHTLTIKYNFDGFYAPVDRPNTMNLSKAGQAIPLKWRLTDALGNPVADLTAITIRVKDQSCAAGTTTDQLEEYAAGASGLQYLGDGKYQFNWKTPTTYVNSCKSVELVYGAGALSYVDGPFAYFSFKK